MDYSYIFQFFLIITLCITLIFGRALYYDDFIEDDNTKLSSNEDNEGQDLKLDLSDLINDENDDDIARDNRSFDSYEEKKFHERSIFSTSQPSNTISAQTRKAIIDILQKAFDQGWRPHLKHYIPATRFGRHR